MQSAHHSNMPHLAPTASTAYPVSVHGRPHLAPTASTAYLVSVHGRPHRLQLLQPPTWCRCMVGPTRRQCRSDSRQPWGRGHSWSQPRCWSIAITPTTGGRSSFQRRSYGGGRSCQVAAAAGGRGKTGSWSGCSSKSGKKQKVKKSSQE